MKILFLDKGWILLTEAYYNQKDYQKALYYIVKALKIDDYNTFYWRKYSDINIKLNSFEEGIKGLEKCIELNDCSLEIYTALSDVLVYVGDLNDAVKILFSAQKHYSDSSEIEYRLSGLCMTLFKKDDALNHLIKGMKINYGQHIIIKDLFPLVFQNPDVQKLLLNYKKATE